jgi:hypothetical protein
MSAATEVSGAVPSIHPTWGMGWRVATSILTVFGLVSFLLVFIAFWSSRFTALQNVVLVLVSILVFIALNGAIWASWGVRQDLRYSSAAKGRS